MAFSKSKLYSEQDQITSSFARAIAHPARLRILIQLSKKGPCKVDELVHNHPISQPSLSDHLKILREAQMVTYKEVFPFILYSVDGKNVIKAEKYLKTFFETI